MTLPLGTRFGPYEILTPLGRGGMGEVYCARDSRLHREVAIKVLNQRLASDETARTRFLREARMAARLDHPNICTLYEIGTERELNYLVMQRLRGETLADRIQREPPSPGEAVEIATQLVEAVAYAHANQVIHRDIKPQNVMIGPDGRVKLMDFGLAKAMEPVDGRTTTYAGSEFGEVLGTIEYMSPEQLAGRPADERSDVFSIGLTLYELFAGQHPFLGPTRAATIAALSSRDAPPLTSVAPDAPAFMEPVLAKALARHPDDRYQSAAGLLADLKAARSPDPAHTRSPDGRPLPFWKRRAAMVVVGCLVVAIAAALTVFKPFGASPGTSATASTEIVTWLEIQPVRTGIAQPAYAAAGDIAVETGWRFRAHVERPGPGWLYLLSDERVRSTGESSLRIVYPAPEEASDAQREGGGAIQSPSYGLTAPPADLALWVVFARAPVPELDALTPLLAGQRVGIIRDAGQADAVRRLLNEAASRVTVDQEAARARARGRGDVVVYRFSLQQQ